jgi:HEAT repeats
MELDPVESRKQIRSLLDANPRAFLSAAVAVLRKQGEMRGAQFVASLLVTSGLLLSALCDPSLSHEEALAIARVAMHADSAKDVMLGRASADRVASSQVIRILEQSAGSRDFLPLLIRLLRQPNPYLRSKAVLMLARDTHNVNWVRKTLGDPDARIRANAVEAIWGVDTIESRELLESLRTDANNRVAGNALLGLYQLGETASIPEMIAMARHEDPAFRTTAAWVMGETGHLRFIDALTGLLDDSFTAPRRGARSALSRIHNAVARTREFPARRVAARFLQEVDSRRERRIALALGAVETTDDSSLLATHLFLAEDGNAVHRYRMERLGSSEGSRVRFLLPASSSASVSAWTGLVLSCLRLKRATDSWSCFPYASGVPQSSDVPAEESGGGFLKDEAAIREDFKRLELLATRTDVWHAVWRSVQKEGADADRGPNLIVCNDSSSDCGPGSALISNARESRALIQVISSVPNSALEDFCKQVNGNFLLGRTAPVLAGMLEQAYLNLKADYVVSYEPVEPQAKALKIALSDPLGCGETSIPIPLPGV